MRTSKGRPVPQRPTPVHMVANHMVTQYPPHFTVTVIDSYNSCARFMWTPSRSSPIDIGKAEGLVYIVSQPNVTITKISGYNEAA